MPHRFFEIAFTPSVKRVQEASGSRSSYARSESTPDAVSHHLTASETAFIEARNSFYMATVSETGWPYIQHRGGPAGFVRVLDEHTIGFADYRGNRQYVSVGNLTTDNRVSLFFMDYANRTRLKMFGRALVVGLDDQAMLPQIEMPHYRAHVERGFLITVEGFDWNCPQHITERYTPEEMLAVTAPLTARIAELEAVLAGGRASSPVE